MYIEEVHSNYVHTTYQNVVCSKDNRTTVKQDNHTRMANRTDGRNIRARAILLAREIVVDENRLPFPRR